MFGYRPKDHLIHYERHERDKETHRQTDWDRYRGIARRKHRARRKHKHVDKLRSVVYVRAGTQRKIGGRERRRERETYRQRHIRRMTHAKRHSLAPNKFFLLYTIATLISTHSTSTSAPCPLSSNFLDTLLCLSANLSISSSVFVYMHVRLIISYPLSLYLYLSHCSNPGNSLP